MERAADITFGIGLVGLLSAFGFWISGRLARSPGDPLYGTATATRFLRIYPRYLKLGLSFTAVSITLRLATLLS